VEDFTKFHTASLHMAKIN